MVATIVIVMSFAIFLSIVYADLDMLQDVCVADLASMKVNGFPYKVAFNEMDFFYNGLAKPGLPNNTLGSLVTRTNVKKIPGLNTLDLSLAHGDFAPFGLIAPHTHPRATEIVFVLYGELYARFITTTNVLVAKTIKAGKIFVFFRVFGPLPNERPKHSQLPGAPVIVITLFAVEPTMPNDVLAKALQIDAKEVEMIKAKLVPKS
ncbi:germin-like protein subfamily 2 member 2 [Eucalyptus grandis]|uniref:germin-like protein subfamily 2 member 2 n=1 Tax=Eucalyptus grandis TaxID=71139 RepID=UPI00192EBAF9|nr:germin-like protein subfamily 2 member 2 [Eucalyptus grandis]